MAEQPQPPEQLKPLKTWSHLADRRKRPSEYEIVSTKLHYRQNNPDAPWELDRDLHMNQWYRRYCNDSPLTHPDWDAFRDPDALVYRTYNILQDGQENYVGSLFDQFSERGHDGALAPDWVQVLARLYAPARYLFHTVQLASAYIAQMAPASTISNCAIFQAADSLRWMTHTAYRTSELAKTHKLAGFAVGERRLWEEEPAWQGFRELMETALVAWDWAEAFVAINLVAKPAIEEALLGALGSAARSNGDMLYALLSQAQMRDAERHRRGAAALVTMALEVEPNRALLQGLIDKWNPLARRAVELYCRELPDGVDEAAAALGRFAAFQASLGLGAGVRAANGEPG